MKKFYNSPDMEIIRYTLIDVLSGSPGEDNGEVGDEFNNGDTPVGDDELTGDGL